MGLINTAVAIPNARKTPPILAYPASDPPLRERSGRNADQVANEITPGNPEPQN